jgi:hypothetical protein
MNLAKSLIGRKKTIVIIAHLCSEMAAFDRNSIRCFQSIDLTFKTKECHSILIKDSNYRPFRVSDGSTVNNLLKLWVCKLSFLKRHPSVQKSKILKYRELLQWKEKELFPVGTPRLIDWPNGGFPVKPVFFKHAAEVRVSPKFFKILKNWIQNYHIIIRMEMYWIVEL